MGTLIEPSHLGDTKLIWNTEVEAEVEAARKVFDELKGKGYFAYSVKADGEPGEVLDEFDPDEEKIIMALPMRGG